MLQNTHNFPFEHTNIMAANIYAFTVLQSCSTTDLACSTRGTVILVRLLIASQSLLEEGAERSYKIRRKKISICPHIVWYMEIKQNWLMSWAPILTSFVLSFHVWHLMDKTVISLICYILFYNCLYAAPAALIHFLLAANFMVFTVSEPPASHTIS